MGGPWSPGAPSFPPSSGKLERGKQEKRMVQPKQFIFHDQGGKREGERGNQDKEKWVFQESGPKQKWIWMDLWTWRFLHLTHLLTWEMALRNKYLEHMSMCLCERRQRVKREAWSTLFHLDIYCFKMLERDDIFHTWFFLKYKANPLCIKQWRAFLRVRTLKDSCVLFYFVFFLLGNEWLVPWHH